MFDNKRVMAGLADIGKYLEDFNRNLRFITCFYREDSIILFPHKFTQVFFYYLRRISFEDNAGIKYLIFKNFLRFFGAIYR